MKKIILFTLITMLFVITSTPTYATVEGITAENYLTYEKPIKDPRDCYNKGGENAPEDTYIDGEELFYDDYTDHWNVDLVYDIDYIKQVRQAESIAAEKTTTTEKAVKKVTKKKTKKSKKKNKKSKKNKKKSKK